MVIGNPDGTRPRIRCGSIPPLRGRDFRCIHGDADRPYAILVENSLRAGPVTGQIGQFEPNRMCSNTPRWSCPVCFVLDGHAFAAVHRGFRMDATMSRDRRFAFGLLYGLDTSGSVGRLTSGTCNPVSESVTTRDSGGVRPRGVHLPRNGMNHPLPIPASRQKVDSNGGLARALGATPGRCRQFYCVPVLSQVMQRMSVYPNFQGPSVRCRTGLRLPGHLHQGRRTTRTWRLSPVVRHGLPEADTVAGGEGGGAEAAHGDPLGKVTAGGVEADAEQHLRPEVLDVDDRPGYSGKAFAGVLRRSGRVHQKTSTSQGSAAASASSHGPHRVGAARVRSSDGHDP